jgi:hypothetical protein
MGFYQSEVVHQADLWPVHHINQKGRRPEDPAARYRSINCSTRAPRADELAGGDPAKYSTKRRATRSQRLVIIPAQQAHPRNDVALAGAEASTTAGRLRRSLLTLIIVNSAPRIAARFRAGIDRLLGAIC